MKRILLYFALFAAAVCRAESPADRAADSLLQCGDWFALERLLAETTGKRRPIRWSATPTRRPAPPA
ncbi:MAG: hypothetical protein K2K30_04050 [Alistipes sp.]|nr:hypothetical protein [Alistipes sp.]